MFQTRVIPWCKAVDLRGMVFGKIYIVSCFFVFCLQSVGGYFTIIKDIVETEEKEGGEAVSTGKDSFPRREERSVYGGAKARDTKRTNQKKEPKPKKQKIGRGKQTPHRKDSRRRMMLGMAGVILLILLFAGLRKNGTEVFVAAESVGILEGRSVKAETIIDTIETQLEGTVGSAVQINEEISAKRIHIWGSRKKDISTMDYLIPKIRNMITYKVDAAIIMIDGGKSVVLPTEEAANKVLDQVKAPYLPAEGVEVTTTWVEKVEVKKEFVDSEEILSEEDAVTSLQATTTVTGTYTVKSGDAFYKIAQTCETTVEEILKRNEGMTINTPIYVGQVLNVPVEKPRLSIKTIETQVLTTVEPKTYEYRTDANQSKAYQKVLQQGRAGQKKSTIQITRVNGFVEEEKEVSKEIITEPVPEIIVRGTL